MKLPSIKTALGLSIALLASAAVQAVPLGGVVFSATGNPSAGVVGGWCETSPGVLSACNGSTAGLLDGSAAAPGGNVELSKFGGAVASFSGTAGGHTYTFSSLVYSDWTANGNWLANSYITGAANSVSMTLTAAQLADARNQFLLNDASINPWERVSDANVSYVDVAGGVVAIGLGGYLNAAPVLNAMFGSTFETAQVSEVLKVTVDGGAAQYLFGFTATPSGVAASDPTRSFNGNYAVSTAVPEPESLALLGLGLVGLVATRRRAKRQG